MSDDPNTLGYHLNKRGSIFAVCHNPECKKSDTQLDLQLLVDKLGPDFFALHQTLTPKLYCSACGSKQVSIRIIPFSNASTNGAVG
ncbi:MAG TPA: hypothetical protein VHP34_11425 [Alphaproteobacteria bacterium]|nr:hypothetical protein [Alphaproteobacteria bacterium]